MELVAVLVGVLAGVVAGTIVALVVVRGREHDARHTLDMVLAVAGDKLGAQTVGVHGELERVSRLVAELQHDKALQHGQLVQGIDEAVRASLALNDTTRQLREALANSRARGQWGERMADDVLRAAGFLEGVNYEKQRTLDGNGGRPDFTFLLPRDRVLHMDVKFPVDNYLRWLEARTDLERDTFAAAFVRDVRGRVKELAVRDYVDAQTTVGYVLLFIPNEAVYGCMHELDPGLLDEALAQRVVLCSPCTLFAVLGVVRQAVDVFLLSRTSDEILDCLAGFTKQWLLFAEKLDRLGSNLTTAQRAYDELVGPRRRQLEKELDRIEALRTDGSSLLSA